MRRPSDPFAQYVASGIAYHQRAKAVWNTGVAVIARPASLGVPATPAQPGRVTEVMTGRAIHAPIENRAVGLLRRAA